MNVLYIYIFLCASVFNQYCYGLALGGNRAVPESLSLFKAIEANDVSFLERRIQKNPKALYVCNPDGQTLLHHAALHGRSEMITGLIKVGLSPDTYDNNGLTPLFSAVRDEKVAVAQALLEGKADPNMKTKDAEESTPLHAAVKAGNLELVALLLKHNANPFAKAVVLEGGKRREVWPIYHAGSFPEPLKSKISEMFQTELPRASL